MYKFIAQFFYHGHGMERWKPVLFMEYQKHTNYNADITWRSGICIICILHPSTHSNLY